MRLPRSLRADAIAGLTGAVVCVPDGMAASVLAGVNPIHGLYASFAGTIAGGAVASTQLMVIATTGATALAAGSAIRDVSAADRPAALFLLTLIAGAVMVVAGLLRLGRYTRFVSHSVMIGFLTGVAVNVTLGQLPHLTGVPAQGDLPIQKAFWVVAHPGQIQLASLLTGLATIAILAALRPTRFANVAALVGLVVPTTAVALLGAEGVATVADEGPIPGGLPLPALPHLSLLSLELVAGALAVVVIVLVQGAGVGEAAPNPDGAPTRPNRDFIAQGAGNVASGIFQGQPVGGSVGQTALNVAAGARSRAASIGIGLWLLLILLAFSDVVGTVAIPTLAGVLIFAAVSSLRLGEMATVLRTGPTSQIAIVTTFVATLVLPIAAAVGIGVALSLMLQLNQEAMDLRVVELVPLPDGTLQERPAPARLESHRVVLLDAYGSLLYAGARTLQARLPDPEGAVAPVVVLRLRGRTTLGSTFFLVVADYSRRLRETGGKLYLSGVSEGLARQVLRSRGAEISGPVGVFEATGIIGESSRAAYEAAGTWLVEHEADAGSPRA
jgi:SulP family sulfate permease